MADARKHKRGGRTAKPTPCRRCGAPCASLSLARLAIHADGTSCKTETKDAGL